MKLDVYAHPDYTWEAARIVEEAKDKDINATLIFYDGLRLELEDEARVYYRGKLREIAEAAIFRTASYKRKPKYTNVAKIIRAEYERRGSYIFNWEVMKNKMFNKFNQQLIFSGAGLAYVKSYYFQNEKDLYNKDLAYPFVVKPLNSSHGTGVKKVVSREEIDKYLNENEIKNVVFQELMAEGKDYRVIVLGDKVLGVMERSGKKGSFVNNISDGAKGRRVELDDEGQKLAIDVAKASGAEYAGVDLIRDKEGKWRVLELNRFAEFRGFEEYTGVNVAMEIVEYVRKNLS